MKIIVILLMLCSVVYADEIDFDRLVGAIYRAEGGEKAQYLYGIRSVGYDNKAEARQICLNTVRNQMKRHNNHTCNLTYLECLAKRYCPVGADNDPKGLNRHWLRNVKYIYERRSP